MGLDMYLTAERFFRPNEYELKKAIEAVLGEDTAGLKSASIAPSVCSVQVNAAYWRKANAIHRWFVDNVQDGEDDCMPHGVDREQLAELRDLCQAILDKKKPPEALPPQAGFFFGPTEIGDWYYAALRSTVEQLDGALTLPDNYSFEYCSSW